jgi:pyruvate,orthophosphate dikinase
MSTGALEANRTRTAIEVVIPDEHLVLLEITERWRGVRDATHALLREVHHRYPGWAETLSDLHRRAMGDLPYYDEHERGAEGLAVLSDLYAKIVAEASPEPIRAYGLRLWLAFLEKLSERPGPRAGRNLAVVASGLERVAETLQDCPDRRVEASPGLRRVTRALSRQLGAGETLEQSLVLLAESLDGVYGFWSSVEDPSCWYPTAREHLQRPRPEAVAAISPGRIRSTRRALHGLRARPPLTAHAAELLALPDNAQIVRGYLEAAHAVGAAETSPWAGALARATWLVHVLGQERLSPVHEDALREIARSAATVLGRPGNGERERFLREVFAVLRARQGGYAPSVLAAFARIGRETLATGEPELVDAFLDEALSLDFHYPSFAGFTSDWEARVDPAHVQNVRAYLSVVEAHPVLGRPLLTALVAHLKLGGVFVADSDLFQRDVSSLLARNVRPVYAHVKQLLRLLPVYFNEIGAEGALRESSTRLDEIGGRRDALCHLLRKQSHVECNPSLIPFAEEIARFWASGDPRPLRRFVPACLYEELDAGDEGSAGMRRIFSQLLGAGQDVGEVFGLPVPELDRRIADISGASPAEREKAALLARVWREIRRKYALDHTDVVERLASFRRVAPAGVGALAEALETGSHELALEFALGLLEELRSIVLDERESRPVESIYLKRHIAVGIPSMYGSYREDRFEAMGLTFRLESLVTALLERVVDEASIRSPDEETLHRVSRWLHLLMRALRVDGYRARGLAHALSLLDETVANRATAGMYVNVFQLLSRSLESSMHARVLDAYEEPVQRVVARMVETGILECEAGRQQEEVLARSETFLRDLIAESLGLQKLDRVIGQTLATLAEERGRAHPQRRPPPPTPDLERCVVRIAPGAVDGQGILGLGNKGFMLEQLAGLGFPVPPGFVLTTDLFHGRGAVRRSAALRRALEQRLREEIGHLEERSGARFADPERPLLLSVRGGGPVSMPGMLESFLNVGLNAEVAEGMAALPTGAWAAWDSFRRFLQFWGMSHGLERDLFDRLIAEAKLRRSVPKKALLEPADMRALAFSYARLLADHGVDVVQDPWQQLLACIELVHRSWDSEKARLYRRAVQLDEGWGTGVIVQTMVFGNLGPRSGTGVVLTRNPRQRSEALELYGDFTVQGQGDDVVSGLVETFPIGEHQRRCEAPRAACSLEADFPAIHAGLANVARVLVEEQGLNHQEIEFTFEGDALGQLFILQTRDTTVESISSLPVFEPTEALEGSLAAGGVGVGGGALCGRVAWNGAELAAIRRRFPRDAIILLRPDTVPDDIPLVLQADGVLTAVGGATSHAAVAAKRLGKTCVVGCRLLEIDDQRGRAALGGHVLAPGDLLSINGIDGSVYLGAHPVRTVSVARVSQPRRAGHATREA